MMKSDTFGVYEKGKHKAWTGAKNTKEYDIWKAMMLRCYSEKAKKKHPTYAGCTVCDEWHNFQNFAEWHKSKMAGKSGKIEIDKDLKFFGNKIYSPDTCLLIDKSVNLFIKIPRNGSSKYLTGVSITKWSGKYRSRCSNPITKKTEQIGSFLTEIEAHIAWRERKSELAYELAELQSDDEVKHHLKVWADNIDIHVQ